MVRPGQKYITITNFLYFLDKDQAFKAFGIFEATETGEITKHAFAKWVVNAYKERRALGLTLNDNKTIIEKLHTVLNGVSSMLIYIYEHASCRLMTLYIGLQSLVCGFFPYFLV